MTVGPDVARPGMKSVLNFELKTFCSGLKYVDGTSSLAVLFIRGESVPPYGDWSFGATLVTLYSLFYK